MRTTSRKEAKRMDFETMVDDIVEGTNKKPLQKYEASIYYNDAKSSIEIQLQELRRRLDLHSKHQSQHSRDWGYVGDLENVSSSLDDIINFVII